MSATLPNVHDLSAWLGASLYSTSYRPVNLETRLCYGGKVYKVQSDQYQTATEARRITTGGDTGMQDTLVLDRVIPRLVSPRRASNVSAPPQSHTTATTFDPSGAAGAATGEDKGSPVNDEDGFFALCFESIHTNKSLMVFCSTKRRYLLLSVHVTRTMDVSHINMYHTVCVCFLLAM